MWKQATCFSLFCLSSLSIDSNLSTVYILKTRCRCVAMFIVDQNGTLCGTNKDAYTDRIWIWIQNRFDYSSKWILQTFLIYFWVKFSILSFYRSLIHIVKKILIKFPVILIIEWMCVCVCGLYCNTVFSVAKKKTKMTQIAYKFCILSFSFFYNDKKVINYNFVCCWMLSDNNTSWRWRGW